jgi:hypothetical protein
MEKAQVYFKLPDRFPPWPKYDPPFPLNSKNMFGKLICYPPLGESTEIPHSAKHVTFRVALEVRTGDENEWDVALWHDHMGVWTETIFESTALKPQDIVRMSLSDFI